MLVCSRRFLFNDGEKTGFRSVEKEPLWIIRVSA